jgi:hypothetical protein
MNTNKDRKHQWNLSNWLSSKRITTYDLDNHPCIDDVVKLINIRDYFWDKMNLNEQAIWGAYWNIVYNHRRFLREKAWTKFENIAKNIDSRHQVREHQRQLIKARRNNSKTESQYNG